MPGTLGVLLMPHKRDRVLSCEVTAELAAAGVRALHLDAAADPSSWAQVDCILHKLPSDPGLLDRLDRYAHNNPGVAIIDPPAAVRAAGRRDAMLAPLQPGAGGANSRTGGSSISSSGGISSTGLLLGPPPEVLAASASERGSHPITVLAPPQVTLLPGMSPGDALREMRAAGVALPALVKPLHTAPAVAVAAAGATARHPPAGTSAFAVAPGTSSSSSAPGKEHQPEAAQADGEDSSIAAQPPLSGLEANHAMGVLLGEDGLGALLAGAVQGLSPPVVVQQFLPHGQHLYKVYVVGPGNVLAECRATLTLDDLHRSAAAAAPLCSSPNPPQLALLQGRASADRLLPAAASTAPSGAPTTGSSGSQGAGLATEPCPLPRWALAQLAQRFEEAMGLTLFNMDVILPEQQHQEGSSGPQTFYVVDVNYLPGFDKVPGAQVLLGRYLAQRVASAAAGAALARELRGARDAAHGVRDAARSLQTGGTLASQLV